MTVPTGLPPLPARAKDAHKGDFGRVLVVAGSTGMVGAACLAAQSALRSGAGLVWLATPASVQPVAAAKLSCVMTVPLAETPARTVGLAALDPVLAHGADAILVGPGLDRHPETDLFVQALAERAPVPLVVDADGLNAVAEAPGCLHRRQGAAVLTPHPGEMARVAGRAVSAIQADRRAAAADLAKKTGAVVALKGAGTVVADGTRTFVNPTGNPGMATAGSGDVLAGVAAGLLGQGLDPYLAAATAVYVHGLAGDIAREAYGEISMTADHILDCLPEAFQLFQNDRE